MKLTPLDIHHKEFRHSLRGYAEEEVDQFLDEVADEFERLFKENIDMAEKLEAANERVRGYQSMEATLNNTMVAAQRSSEDIIAKAGVEADTMLRDAELKSKEIIHNALQKKQAIANELIRIKQAEEEFRNRYKSLLETQLRGVNEITLPEDVNVLLGDTDDGFVGDVEVRPVAPVEAPAAAPLTAFESPAPEQAPQPIVAPEDQATTVMPVVEPPPAGFVQSVTLGEVGEADLPQGSVELVDPDEFSLPGFDVLGERDNDIDIEEID
jgi:cell division initiation protein